MMKKFILLLFFVSFFIPLSSGRSDTVKKKELHGKWVIVSFSEMDIPEDQKTYYIFQKNGIFMKKLFIYDYEETNIGRWKMEGQNLIIVFPDQEKTVIYEISFEEGSLVLRRLGMSTKLERVLSP